MIKRFLVFNVVMVSFLMVSAPWLMASPSQLSAGLSLSKSWKDGTPELVEWTRELLREGGGRAFMERNAPQREVLPAPPKVGTVRRFFAMDLSTEQEYVLSATLRAVSAHALWYVENAQWEQGVTMADITALVKAFEQSTPAHTHQGIYALETEGLAPIPDIDDDARLNILILDIRDGASSGAQSFVAGYFSPFNQYQGSVRAPSGEVFHSNEAELLYLDCAPLNVGSSDAQGVIAHELAHLIHWGLDPEEEVWIDEGCADYAMWLTGYPPVEHLRSFEQTPHVPLVENDAAQFDLPHYGASFAFIMYLQERYGREMIPALMKQRATGIEGVNAAIGAHGNAENFDQVFVDWKVANVLDAPNVDVRYGYQSIDLHLMATRRHHAYPVKAQGSLLPYTADYLELTGLPQGEDKALELQVMGGHEDFDRSKTLGTELNPADFDTLHPAEQLDLQVAVLKGGSPLFVKPMPLNPDHAIPKAGHDRGEHTLTIPLAGADRILLIPSVQSKRLRLSTVYTYAARLVSLTTVAVAEDEPTSAGLSSSKPKRRWVETTESRDRKTTRFHEGKLAAHSLPPDRIRTKGSALAVEAVLGQNYPNPFNPETWIPYQLASDAHGSITIYNALGQPVRRLNLGHQSAGLYLTKEKAAYWDGRSETGEFVPSGMYFYQLSAGDFTAVKRMVILK